MMVRSHARSAPFPLVQVEGAGVDAVAPARRGGAVPEDMAEVATAPPARHLGTGQEEGEVPPEGDGASDRRLGEARPPGTRVELRTAVEQDRTATGAAEGAILGRVDVLAGERTFGPPFPQDPVLLGAQLGPPLVVGLADLGWHRSPSHHPMVPGW